MTDGVGIPLATPRSTLTCWFQPLAWGTKPSFLGFFTKAASTDAHDGGTYWPEHRPQGKSGAP